ncbi:hypothetical protein [Ferrimonas sp. SCSIO 43195]|uniref:hypothetical protein n=1 Tax=Ferrimonas sp. SCSIO 43195 TaxID=2822844 RepID=UPI002076502A|nr:hypothetical protein [Ferrimonas sp. SCSIO 43195]USD36553.1 hypothetical protein J8Z22_16255 [Ferrimonas sp. SCSIO 43195]
MDVYKAIYIIDLVLSGLRTDFDYIDVTDSEQRSKQYDMKGRLPGLNRLASRNSDGSVHLYSSTLSSSLDDSLANIVYLISNPRNLKLVLNQTKNNWHYLHGEIDLEDLFMLNVLEVCVPKTILILKRYISELRRIHQLEAGRQDNLKERFEKEIEKECQPLNSYVLPIIKDLMEYDVDFVSSQGEKQLIRSSWPRDYFQLYIDKKHQTEKSDQYWLEFIRKMKGAGANEISSGNFDDAISYLILEDGFPFIECFGLKVLQFERILDIASKSMDFYLDKHGNRNFIETFSFRPKSFFSLVHLVENAKRDSSILDWFLSEYKKIVNKNFAFANDFYYWFSSSVGNDIRQAREETSKYVKELFEILGDSAFDIFDPDWNYISSHFIVLFDQSKYGGVEEFSNLNWYLEFFLDNYQGKENIVIPQITTLLVEDESDFHGTPVRIRNNAWKFVTDKNRKKIVDVFSVIKKCPSLLLEFNSEQFELLLKEASRG